MENGKLNFYNRIVESLSFSQSHRLKHRNENLPFCFPFPLEEGLERELSCMVKAHTEPALLVCLFLLAQRMVVIDRENCWPPRWYRQRGLDALTPHSLSPAQRHRVGPHRISLTWLSALASSSQAPLFHSYLSFLSSIITVSIYLMH